MAQPSICIPSLTNLVLEDLGFRLFRENVFYLKRQKRNERQYFV